MSGDRPEKHVVHALMDEHMLMHGVPVLFDKDGVLVPAPRCSIWPCRSAGLAFAAFEMRWFEINASEQEEAALFEVAATRLPLRDEIREAFRAMATQRREALFSRPLQVQWSRRPRAVLEQAVAQHLERAGFSHPSIAELMGCTSKCAEKRCAAPDIRSVMPYVENRLTTE